MLDAELFSIPQNSYLFFALYAFSMKIIKKILLYSFRAVLFFSLLLIVYFLFAVVLSLIPVNKNFKNAEDGIAIYIRTNGVHTDFVVPVSTKIIDWREKIPFTDFDFVDSSFRYICFGWGNREFYIDTKEWSDLKFSTAIRAGLGIGKSAMHVEYKRKILTNENWIRFRITETNYNKLVEYILQSFIADQNNNFIHIPNSGYYSNDTFYEGKGSYNLIKTCNEWTGKGMRVSGIKTGAWTPFEQSIMYRY